MRKIFFPSSKPGFINEKEIIADFKKLALKQAGDNPDIEEVYLFGSYARHTAGLHSDVDLLVIVGGADSRGAQRAEDFILKFSDGPVPADVLVKTRTEVNRAVKEGNRFLADALKGIKLL